MGDLIDVSPLVARFVDDYQISDFKTEHLIKDAMNRALAQYEVDRIPLYQHTLQNCRNIFTTHLSEIEQKFGLYPKMSVAGLLAEIDFALGKPLDDGTAGNPANGSPDAV
jgi:hypothetical protein